MNRNIFNDREEAKSLSYGEPRVRCQSCNSLIPLSSEVCPSCRSDVYGFESNSYDEVKCENDFCDYIETTKFSNNRYAYPGLIIVLIIILILGFKYNDFESTVFSRPSQAHSDGNSFSIEKENGDFANFKY